MTMNDPIADMLTRVRNANAVCKPTVSMPSSKKLVEIARIMTEEGYVQGFDVIESQPRDILEITMKYGEKKAKVIRGIKRISKPGLRIYAGKDELPRVADASHGVLMERVGASGLTANQHFTFDMRIDNPALTAQVLVSSARAAVRLAQSGRSGAYTLIDVPPVLLLPGERIDNIGRLV